MTVKEYIKNHGWDIVCNTEICRFMNVAVNFTNDNVSDETEFTIKAYNAEELELLYTDFCKENELKRNTVNSIVVTAMAMTMEALS